MEVIIGRESGSSRLHISGYNLEQCAKIGKQTAL